jgi:hypothetical protein
MTPQALHFFDLSPSGRRSSSASARPYSASSTRKSSVSLSIGYVKADEYTVWIFIDANDTAAGNETPLPDPGDYGTDGRRDIDMSSDQTVDVGEGEWILLE